MTDINDADFSLDDIIEDVTNETIKTINKDPELYKDVKFGEMGGVPVSEDSVKAICYKYAEAHNNEFGELFQTELDMVDWAEVIRRV